MLMMKITMMIKKKKLIIKKMKNEGEHERENEGDEYAYNEEENR
jgi:hypothetical protein